MSNNPWFSIHVFLSDPVKISDFLIDWLSPYVSKLLQNGQAESFFYINYWEGGPHLRLRFKHLQSPNALLQDISDAARGYTSKNPVSKKDYYQNHNFDGQQPDINSLSWYEEGSVVVIPYEQELIRYAGSHAMRINEQLFHTSSQLALAIIKSTRSKFEQRLTIAASTMITTAFSHFQTLKEVEQFFHHYASFWQDYSANTRTIANSPINAVDQSIVKMLKNATRTKTQQHEPNIINRLLNGALTTALLAFEQCYQQQRFISPITHQTVENYQDYRDGVTAVLSSQIHMMNNRLSIIPSYELHLALLIEHAAKHLQSEQLQEQVE